MGAYYKNVSAVLQEAKGLGVEAEGVDLEGELICQIFLGIGRDDLAAMVEKYIETGEDEEFRVRSEEDTEWHDEFKAAVSRYI